MAVQNYSFPRISYEFLRSPFLKKYLQILRIYFLDYVTTSYRGNSAVNIAIDLDGSIPEIPAIKNYFDIVYFPIVLMARAHMARNLDHDIKKDLFGSTEVLKKIYGKTCSIYRIRQSTFKRNPTKNIFIKLLRIIDRNKNCYPSLHAQIIAEVYNTFLGHERIITKGELLDKTSRILEACFLLKQHSIQDIAVGLGGVSLLDADFTRERAVELINNIFKDKKYGMDNGLCDEIRSKMTEIYDQILNMSKNTDYEKTFLDQLNLQNNT